MNVTSEDQEPLYEEGYAVIPDVLSAAEITSYQARPARALAG